MKGGGQIVSTFYTRGREKSYPVLRGAAKSSYPRFSHFVAPIPMINDQSIIWIPFHLFQQMIKRYQITWFQKLQDTSQIYFQLMFLFSLFIFRKTIFLYTPIKVRLIAFFQVPPVNNACCEFYLQLSSNFRTTCRASRQRSNALRVISNVIIRRSIWSKTQ